MRRFWDIGFHCAFCVTVMGYSMFGNAQKRRLEDVDFSQLFKQQKIETNSKVRPNDSESYRVQPGVSGWVTRPSHIDMMDFALNNLPSTWSPHRVAWVHMKNYASDRNLHYGENDSHAYCGKWMWFVYENAIDEKFIMLVDALQNGLLGDSIKTMPTECKQYNYNQASVVDNATRKTIPLIVYTNDFRDKADVLRVGLALRKLGATQTISYKPDVFTLSDDVIHGANKIPKTIYTLKKDSSELTLVDRDNAYAIAVQMVTGEKIDGKTLNTELPVLNAKATSNNDNNDTRKSSLQSSKQCSSTTSFLATSTSEVVFTGTGHRLGGSSISVGNDLNCRDNIKTSKPSASSDLRSSSTVKGKQQSVSKTSGGGDKSTTIPKNQTIDLDFWDDVV